LLIFLSGRALERRNNIPGDTCLKNQ